LVTDCYSNARAAASPTWPLGVAAYLLGKRCRLHGGGANIKAAVPNYRHTIHTGWRDARIAARSSWHRHEARRSTPGFHGMVLQDRGVIPPGTTLEIAILIVGQQSHIDKEGGFS